MTFIEPLLLSLRYLDEQLETFFLLLDRLAVPMPETKIFNPLELSKLPRACVEDRKFRSHFLHFHNICPTKGVDGSNSNPH